MTLRVLRAEMACTMCPLSTSLFAQGWEWRQGHHVVKQVSTAQWPDATLIWSWCCITVTVILTKTHDIYICMYKVARERQWGPSVALHHVDVCIYIISVYSYIYACVCLFDILFSLNVCVWGLCLHECLMQYWMLSLWRSQGSTGSSGTGVVSYHVGTGEWFCVLFIAETTLYFLRQDLLLELAIGYR